MPASRLVIDAYKRLYTLPELKEKLRICLEDRASGVQITQANFQDAGGSGQMMQVDPNEIIEILEIAIQEKEAEAGNQPLPGLPPLASCMNFRTRRSET